MNKCTPCLVKLKQKMRIDTKTKDVSVWLVKFPPILAKLFEQIEGDREIGHIEIVKPDGTNENKTAQLKLRLNVCDVDFIVQWNEIGQIMYVLKGMEEIEDYESNDNLKQKQLLTKQELKLEGKVSKEVFISPVFDEKYFNLKMTQDKQNRSVVKIIDYASNKRLEKYTTLSEMDALTRRRKKLLQQNKRERLARPEVMDIVFRAFEIQDHWTVRDLADYSGQPNAYISEILGEIGELDKGDFRGSWTLKEEYRNK